MTSEVDAIPWKKVKLWTSSTLQYSVILDLHINSSLAQPTKVSVFFSACSPEKYLTLTGLQTAPQDQLDKF